MSDRSGRLMVRLVLLMLAAGLALGAAYAVLQQSRTAERCADQLRAIYRALDLYELERGTLPALAFFPSDPLLDPDSLRVVLEPMGAGGDICVCPRAHPSQKELGLTYVWNAGLNGRKLPRTEQVTWMLVEMVALSADLPSPHLGGYNVLFTDGSVRRVARPLEELKGL